MTSQKKCWSYSAGDWGAGNRVRVYEKTPSGDLYLEWYEGTREVGRSRRRAKLSHRDRARAKGQAKKVAARLETAGDEQMMEPPAPLSVRRLFADYMIEVTPGKGVGKQSHDRRAEKVFMAFFDSQREPERRSTRHPSTLDRVDWDRF